MITFLKAQANSLISSVVDFLVTVMLVELFSVWYLTASVIGTVSGGITNFCIGRNWVFGASEGKPLPQAVKYLMVWVGNLLLNAGGVFLLTQYGQVNYVLSKVLTALVVGFTYNFFLQKKFVFR